MHGSLSAGSSWSNGLGLQPRGEGGKEGEGPCVSLLSLLLHVTECAEAADSREGGGVAGAWASESLLEDLQETP